MTPAEVRAALGELERQRTIAGLPAPVHVVPTPTPGDFDSAEESLSIHIPASIREWFIWRNGVPFGGGNKYRDRLLVPPWEHLTFDQSIDDLAMLREIHRENELPPEILDGWFPLLRADATYLMVGVMDGDLPIRRYDEGDLDEEADGPTLLQVLESWTRRLSSGL